MLWGRNHWLGVQVKADSALMHCYSLPVRSGEGTSAVCPCKQSGNRPQRSCCLQRESSMTFYYSTTEKRSGQSSKFKFCSAHTEASICSSGYSTVPCPARAGSALRRSHSAPVSSWEACHRRAATSAS